MVPSVRVRKHDDQGLRPRMLATEPAANCTGTAVRSRQGTGGLKGASR